MPSGPFHLPKAPIVEAVFDIRVEGADHFDATAYAELAKAEIDRYPDQAPQMDFEVLAEFPATGEATAKQRVRQIGVLLKSADGRDLAQVNERGVTLHRLAPYTSWQALRPEVLRLSRLHLAYFPAGRCVRAAIRTINRIELDDVVGLKDVLRVPPTMPALLGLESNGFLMRHEMTDEVGNMRAIVHQASAPQAGQEAGRAIILDIDVFKGLAAESVDDTFEGLHRLKNRIFQKAIVPAWIRRYK